MKTRTYVLLLAATLLGWTALYRSLEGQTKDTGPRYLTSIAYASLGTPANGAIVYCSDCTAANPCTGSGGGTFAKRENGAWNCGGGGGDGITSVTQQRYFAVGLGCTQTGSVNGQDLSWLTASNIVDNTLNCDNSTATQQQATFGAAHGNTVTVISRMPFPIGFVAGSMNATFYAASNASGNTDTIYHRLETACLGDGEAFNSALTYNTAQTVGAAWSQGQWQLQRFNINNVTTTGCAAGEIMYFRWGRDGTNGSETDTNQNQYLGLRITWQVNQ